MYAHVNIWRLSETGATADDSAARELTAHLRQQPGFQSYTLVRPNEREVVAVTVFDSETQLERALESVVGLVQQRIGPLTEGSPRRRKGDVLHHVTA